MQLVDLSKRKKKTQCRSGPGNEPGAPLTLEGAESFSFPMPIFFSIATVVPRQVEFAPGDRFVFRPSTAKFQGPSTEIRRIPICVESFDGFY